MKLRRRKNRGRTEEEQRRNREGTEKEQKKNRETITLNLIITARFFA